MPKEKRYSPAGYLIDPKYYHELYVNPSGYTWDMAWSSENYKVFGVILNFESSLFCTEERMGFCQLDNPIKKCFAKVRERQYWHPWEMAEKQREVWRDLSRDRIADMLIKSLSRGKRLERAINPMGFVKIRLCERGGVFGGQWLLEKADYVMGKVIAFARSEGIRAMAQLFTSREDLDVGPIEHLLVRKSGTRGPAYHGRAVMFYSRADVPRGYILCKEDCRVCACCHIRGRDIALIYHSALTAQAESRVKPRNVKRIIPRKPRKRKAA